MITRLPGASVSVTTSATPLQDCSVSFVSTLQFQAADLRPVIPKDEEWLYRNPKTLKRVIRGLAEASEGKGRVLSFARYANEE